VQHKVVITGEKYETGVKIKQSTLPAVDANAIRCSKRYKNGDGAKKTIVTHKKKRQASRLPFLERT
jgi:hypothetical protein